MGVGDACVKALHIIGVCKVFTTAPMHIPASHIFILWVDNPESHLL